MLIFYSHKVTRLLYTAKVCEQPHYYEWHAFVLFLRLCFLHVCLCGKCVFVLMSGKKVCLMTLDAPLKYQIHHSGCVVNHHGDMEQLNLCLSQA